MDREARRLELAEALWRITRRDGWEAISLRKVAAEAGVSMGMVQHYFASKDQMLRFALEIIIEDVRRHIRQCVARLPQPHTPRQLVTTVLTEMIPRPGLRRNEAETAAVFLRRFMLSPDSAAELAAGQPDLGALLAEQIRLSRAASGKGRPADAERDAGGLIALLDGLILAVVTKQQTTETALAIMHAQLNYVFGDEPE